MNSSGIPQMDMHLFYQWVGYLCHPTQQVAIHVESPPDKKQKFLDEYKNLTGTSLNLPENASSFYVWRPGVNKRGVQQRIYFLRGDTPSAMDEFNVTKGRSKGQLRINSKKFIPWLFEAGFRIGRLSQDQVKIIKNKVPQQYEDDFNKGYDQSGGGRAGGQADPEVRQRIENTAVECVKQYYKEKGYDVISVERDNVGWDLEAKKGDTKLLVEVKGHQGAKINCELTPNEYNQIEKDDFLLAIVTSALDKPCLRIFQFSPKSKEWKLLHGKVVKVCHQPKTGAKIYEE